jgi:phosphopantothenoylcysteine decarboxylase/phosphopantothenate--cysteine ligase
MKKIILITAGPTYEHIDPVRFIGNYSSGYQGLCLAKQALKDGNTVILVIGPTHLEIPEDINLVVIKVISADEMYDATVKHFPICDVAICSAAVADYKPMTVSKEKIKRNGDNLTIELVPNKDIAKELGSLKTDKQLLIGFALETNDFIENALKKIVKKNLDYVILNETSKENPAFMSKENRVTIVNKNGTLENIDKTTKENIAIKILELC